MCLTAAAAGLAVSAGGQIAEGMAARDAANFRADALRFQASNAIDRGEFQVGQLRRKANQVSGSQRAAFAAAGLDPGAGTAEALQEETAILAEQSVSQTRSNALLEAHGFRTQADITEFEGDQAFSASFAKAGGSLLSGASEAGLFDKAAPAATAATAAT